MKKSSLSPNFGPGATLTFSVTFGETLSHPAKVVVRATTSSDSATADNAEIALRTVIDTAIDLIGAIHTVAALESVKSRELSALLDVVLDEETIQ